MRFTLQMNKLLCSLFILNCILFISCGSADTASSADSDASLPLRDSTPIVLTPSADGIITKGNDICTIDLSHTDLGYVCISYQGTAPKAKMQLVTPESTTYTYTLHGAYETFPLTGGDGSYKITVFEQAFEDQYTTALSESFSVSLQNEFNTYLYPNQYVNFTADNKTIALGQTLAKGAHSDLEVVSSVYQYIKDNISYDTQKAETVESGYLPVIDDVIASKKGICFDYAAVMASMLRSQGIPTRLDVGYAKEAYHAWVSVYLKDQGWVDGIIEFDGKTWKLMDPTFAASKSPGKMKKFLGDGSNYTVKYVY